MESFQFYAALVFVVLVSIELFIAARKQVKLYEAKDTLNNVLLGVFTFVTRLLMKGLILSVFYFFYQFALFDIGYAWWSWIILFLLNDFLFYAFHRLSHEKRLFWASHVVHHSSTHLNFSTSMRGSFLIRFYKFIFWIPLPLLGFDPLAILILDSFGYFYQLFLHTEIIKSMGPLEWVLNTPSHHRVHHGSNPQYLDKNYGAVLIIWDRLFGTFQPEDEEVEYGLTRNLKDHSLTNTLFHEWQDMLKEAAQHPNWSDKWKVFFSKPGQKYKRSNQKKRSLQQRHLHQG